MRNRLILLALVLVVAVAALAATFGRNLLESIHLRYYQHIIEEKWDEEDAEDGVFVSHLPLVLIETGGAVISEDEKQVVTVSVIDNEGTSNRLTDTPALTTATLINLRGQTSAEFDKQQYRLNFIQSADDETRVDYEVMDLPADSDWILYGPYLDKTLIRNYLVYNLAGEIMDWSPNVCFCEVFVDGEYEGLYVLIEAVTVGENRVNVSKQVDNQDATGYLLLQEREGFTKTVLEHHCDLHDLTGFELGVEYPNAVNITDGNIDYISEEIDEFEEKLYAYGEESLSRAYTDEIDLLSFVDYYVINEFVMNRDAGYFSTYCYSDPRGKLTMGPVWDFNNCFDNHYDPTLFDSLVAANNWFGQLIRDERFAELVVLRYEMLRSTVLSEDRLLSMIDDIVDYLGPAIDRNYERWSEAMADSLLWLYEGEEDRNSYTYEDAIEQLKNAIIQRGRFLDENFETLLNEYTIDTDVWEAMYGS